MLAGLGVDQAIRIINQASPRWAGFNLLAPTYEISARIAAGLDPGIQVMAGGHQAKAMPHHVLADPRFAQLEALVLGEGETRVAELLKDRRYRSELPGVMWLDPVMKTPQTGGGAASNRYFAPDIDGLPFVDRRFLADDPYEAPDGRYEANMVGARGCPYDCSFCGAAVSANPDVTIRTRDPENIIAEMDKLHARYGVTAFRFVDDLFFGYERFIRKCMADRYQHLEHEIRPALQAGRLVLCDRYLASSLVLQRLDGVSPEFVWHLNQHADRPDLCIILSGDASCARERAEKRGLYSRFHRGGQAVSIAEAALYATTATELAEHGFAVLTHDIRAQTPGEVTETLATAVLADEAASHGGARMAKRHAEL